MSLSFKPKYFLRPATESELSEQLRKWGEKARIVAGGTGIYEVAHRGLLSDVEFLLDINDLGLSYISVTSGALKIGAATTMTDLARSSELASRNDLGSIMDALSAIHPLQVKNVATAGGAICTALPFFDLPVALLSVDARVILGPAGRAVMLSDFLQGYFTVALNQGEFVRELELPLENHRASAFQKFAITHDDWALINCAVSLSVDEKAKIVDPRVVFGGGVGDKPVRSKEVENAISGLDANDLSRISASISENVSKDVETITDMRSSAKYRLILVKVLGERTVIQAIARAMDARKRK